MERLSLIKAEVYDVLATNAIRYELLQPEPPAIKVIELIDEFWYITESFARTFFEHSSLRLSKSRPDLGSSRSNDNKPKLNSHVLAQAAWLALLLRFWRQKGF